MDPRFLDYYNRELQHLREVGAEFARGYPKIAGRLGLEEFECADPYVERLLEGLAFLAARIQLKLDAQYPEFTQHLFEIVYPHYLAPTPSTAVVELRPDLNEGALAEGVVIPRGTMLRGRIGKGGQTACRYRTAHDVSLWPLQIKRVDYYTREDAVPDAPSISGVRAGVRMQLRCTAGLTFDKLALDRLPLFLRGPGGLAIGLYEQLLANAVAVIVRPRGSPARWQATIDPSEIRRVGFRDDEAILPLGSRSFQGYRLLHEYFAIPERFLFVELGGLAPALRRCQSSELEIFILFDRVSRVLENRVDASMFALFCSPAVNLFPKRADRIHLDDRRAGLHVLPDRTRPLDYEAYQVTEVVGFGEGDHQQEFLPFYASFDRAASFDRPGRHGPSPAYYTARREHRILSEKEGRLGTRTSYIGSELYLGLVDAQEAPYRSDLRQLAVRLLCTNRDLALLMPVGVGETDFTPEISTPVQSVRCLVGPTPPRPALSYGTGESAWRLANHLSLNYASLVDDPQRGGAAALREMLALYADRSEPHIGKQIDGVHSVVARSVTRPVPADGPLAFARGLEITLTCDESSFEGSGVFLLGAVLEEFFARYVSLNSFTETVVRTVDRGEIMRWPARIGRRQSL
jgi:type VI secretion system protein ImpG